MKRMTKAAATVALTVGIAGMFAAPAQAAETGGTYSNAGGDVSMGNIDILSIEDLDILSILPILPILEGITPGNSNGITQRNINSPICGMINILATNSCDQATDQANTAAMDPAAPGDITIDSANIAE
jgi:hypothetical protein